MVLQPVGADDDVAEQKGQMLAPLLRHGMDQIGVALRPLGRPRHLDLDDQQGQGDGEDRIAESFKAGQAALRAMCFRMRA